MPGPLTVPQSLRRRVAPPLLTAVCLGALTAACFGRALFGGGQYGARDAANFYYPLYQQVEREWRAGRWPLWSPGENAGMPLLGNPTAAVLYPGKLVYTALPYPWAARVYAVLHVGLAFAGLRGLLRRWGISPTGAALGGMAYAFGAPVLNQVSNVVFLVGAAWTPWALLAADGWLRQGRRRSLAGLAAVLALMTLGGDPEAAYVVVVGLSAAAVLAGRPGAGGSSRRGFGLQCVVGLALLEGWSLGLAAWSAWARHAEATGRSVGGFRPPGSGWLFAAWGLAAAAVLRRARRERREGRRGPATLLTGLAGASLLGLAVTGAQLLPVVEFTRLSARGVGAASPGSHDPYPFSLHPAMAAGAVWPELFGTADRGNRCWAATLPPTSDYRIWLPSLYLGGLTLVLAGSAAGLRGGPAGGGRAFLTAWALGCGLAGLGLFGGPVFWARGLPGAEGVLGPRELPEIARVRDDGGLRDGDGSPYALLAASLPVFRSFRYPAKLAVLASLGVAGLAGFGWDRAAAGRPRRALVLATALAAAGLLGLVACQAEAVGVAGWLRARAPAALSAGGPFDAAGAFSELRFAFAYGCLVDLLAAGLLVAAARRPAWAGPAALIFLAADLAVANARQVITLPQSVFEGEPAALGVIRRAELADPSPGPFRVYRMTPWSPLGWNLAGSADRAEETVRWERDTLRPKYGLNEGLCSTFGFGTTEVHDYSLFFGARSVPLPEGLAREYGLTPGGPTVYYPRRGFDLWATRYFVLPGRVAWNSHRRAIAAFVPDATRVWPAPDAFDGPGGEDRRDRWLKGVDWQVLRNHNALPRAWVVHQARTVPPAESFGAVGAREQTDEILYQDDELWHEPRRTPRDPRRVAWVETDRPADVARSLSRLGPDPAEVVTITRDEPQRVELTAVLKTPGLVVLADVNYPGWTLTLDGRPAEILRVNRAMRGAAVGAGEHRLLYRYEPLSFRLGLGLSAAGLVGLISLALGGRGPVPRPDSG